MRPCLARLFFATASLALGVLLPTARAADSTEGGAGTNPGVRAEYDRLLHDLDLYLQAETVAASSRPSTAPAVTPAEKVRRAARRFAAGRLAQMEAESPLSPEERAQWRELVRQHVTRATDAAQPMPLPTQASSTERPRPDSGALAAAAPAAGVAGPQPNATGVLSGRITSAATGTGIGGAAVRLYLSYSSLTVAYADATGNYSFTGLASGAYYVKTNNFDGYIDEAWNNLPCDWNCNPWSSGATSIAVTDGSTTPGIDFALGRGGRISGTVVSAVTSAPIPNLGLTIRNATSRSVTYTYTDAAGVFISYGGLVSGTYRVGTNTSWNSQSFVDEVYDNIVCPVGSCSPYAGTPITVTSPSTTGGIDFALDPGGGLAGRVTEAGTSTGLAGVSVQVRLVGGGGANRTTDASGNWSTLLNAPAGFYTVSTHNDSGYVDEIWNDIPCPGGGYGGCGGPSVGTPIDVSAGTVTSGIDFALDAGGHVAGRVTDAATTAGLSWAEVDIYTENSSSYVAYGYTDGTGNYTTTTGLPTGRYRARTNAFGYYGSNGQYLDEVYDDKPCVGTRGCALAEGASIGVSLGATTGNIDFALDKGGLIAGKVTDASTSAGVAELDVEIYSEGGQSRSYGYTDGSGNYTTFYSLPAGRYYAATYQYGGGTYVNEVYNNVPCAGCLPELNGTPFSVTPGAITSGINFALDRGGSISGRITSAADGTAIAGGVWVFTPTGRVVKNTSATADGNYTLGGLPPGRYLVRTGTSQGFVNEVYDDRPCVGSSCDLTAGTLVTVSAGSTTSINFALSPGARVSGRVTDASTGTGIPGVTISLLKPPSGSIGGFVSTDGLGDFTAGSSYGLPTGGYYVQTSNTLGYLDELYNNIPCVGCDVTVGTKVQLTAGATTGGINFALASGGSGRIAGTVTRAATGDPIALLTVRIYDSTGRQVDSLSTSFLGTYLSGGLPVGAYYVAAVVNTADYVDELYSNVPSCSDCSPLAGTPVTVSAGATTSGIDIALDAGGRIEGRVTDASTSSPLLDAFVSVFNAAGTLERSVPVDALGHYAAQGLAPGTHYALASAGWAYVSQLYSNFACPGCNPTTGTPITVTAGGTTSGKDFALAGGGRIEGTVTRASDGQPLGATVTIYNAAGGVVSGATQDGTGFYRSSGGLPSGTYYAEARDTSGTYDDELFDNRSCNSCNPATGTPVTVTSPAATTGVNFSLGDRSLEFFTLSPCRVVDTRYAPSALGGPALAAREDRVLSVFAACGVPLTARALSVNLTVTGSASPGNLRLHPGGGPVPGASSINYAAGQTRANNAVVPVSRFGELAVYCGQAAGTAHFILDVNGYFQ